MPDFIPRSNGDLLNWLANFKAKISTYTATFGYTAPQITAMQNKCDSLTDKINITEQRKADFQSAVQDQEHEKAGALLALRAEANRMKAHAAGCKA